MGRAIIIGPVFFSLRLFLSFLVLLFYNAALDWGEDNL